MKERAGILAGNIMFYYVILLALLTLYGIYQYGGFFSVGTIGGGALLLGAGFFRKFLGGR